MKLYLVGAYVNRANFIDKRKYSPRVEAGNGTGLDLLADAGLSK
jgi:hypothetical protein